jgi:hypothetical protein
LRREGYRVDRAYLATLIVSQLIPNHERGMALGLAARNNDRQGSLTSVEYSKDARIAPVE